MSILTKRAIRASFYIGGPFVNASNFAFSIAQLGYRFAKEIPSVGREFNVVVTRFDLLVMRSVSLVAISSFAAGVLMALQFSAGVERFGGALYVPSLVALSIVKALGPMLACLMAASRAGGGLAAE